MFQSQYFDMFAAALKVPTFASVDPAGEAQMIEDGKPVMEEAARLTGWPVEDIVAVKYNGMIGTNARVFDRHDSYIDIKLPDHMVN
jgi:hypothetical protein